MERLVVHFDGVSLTGKGETLLFERTVDKPRFQGWRSRYRLALGRPDEDQQLWLLGKDIYAWLDGSGDYQDGGPGWLSNAIPAGLRAPAITFQTSADPSPQEAFFLEVPWELLIKGEERLAQRPGFELIRRLGQPSSPLPASDHRLLLHFMAGAPRGVRPELAYEEEEAAIGNACRVARGSRSLVDLEVEESGCLELLAERQTPLPGGHGSETDVLHLSCHGDHLKARNGESPRPVLLLEDEYGNRKDIGITDLMSELGSSLPRLVFLSACRTGESVRAADSLAIQAVQSGLPTAIAWDGSVRDGEATQFASHFYQRLGRGETPSAAVAEARRRLLVPEPGQKPARDWHLARLYAGPTGGGQLVQGRRKAHSRLKAVSGQGAFLDEKGKQVPVASAGEYVSRRRHIQKVLGALDNRESVLIHGGGNLGKSSLAARVNHRLQSHRLALVYGGMSKSGTPLKRFKARHVLEALSGAARGLAKQAVNEALKQVTDETLDAHLSGLLDEHFAGDSPVLMVLDDLEQILEAVPEGLHRVHPDYQRVLAAVIEAFDGHHGESRLLLTSRYQFTLPHRGRDLGKSLTSVQLHAMSGTAGQKHGAALARVRGRELPSASGRKSCP